MKFRKKPVVIEAERFFSDKDYHSLGVEFGHPLPGVPACYFIRTLEGWHEVTGGDWIITGIKGERYPCKPDIFEATYEPVHD